MVEDVQSEEQAYYRQTAIHPIMHCVVIRGDALEREPRLADAVYDAYDSAKARAARLKSSARAASPGIKQRARGFELPSDAFQYGLTAPNRRVVERLARYLKEQGFIDTIPEIDALFVGCARVR